MDYLYNVATNKEVLLTVRIAEQVRDEFKRVAELRGASMSGLLHQYIVMTIRQEKAASPHEFLTESRVLPVKITHVESIGEMKNERSAKRKTG